MEAVVIFVAIAIFIALSLQKARREFEMAWREAAQRLGLAFAPGGIRATRGVIVGALEGFRVKIDIVRRGSGEDRGSYLRASAGLGGRLPAGVSLTGESDRTTMAKLLSGEDTRTGDPMFDELVDVRGPEVPLRAALSGAARERVLQLIRRGGAVKDGAVVLVLEERGQLNSVAAISWLVEQVVGVARELTAHRGEIQHALAANAREDRMPEARLLNLKTLAQRYPAAAAQALTPALSDPDPRLRLWGAARMQGPGAAAVLAGLVGDVSVDPALRAEALRTLTQTRPYAEVAPSLVVALEDAEEKLQREAVAAVGRFRDASLYERVVRLGPRAGDELAETIAQTLGEMGDGRAERPLLLLLARESGAVKAAAATALGLIGTVDAVEPLLPLTKGLLGSERAKEAAREAIRRIQARLGDVAAGSLSLVEEGAQAGALSVAVPSGAVSLAEPADAPDAATPVRDRSKV